MAERRLLKILFENFINSIKPRRFTGDLVGTDLFGNRYYEIPKNNKHRQRPQRYFEPAKKEDFEVEKPPEWVAWLRNTRKTPPTPEEIAENVKLMEQKKEGATMIAEQFPPSPSSETQKISFPKYGKDYEVHPGSNSQGDK